MLGLEKEEEGDLVGSQGPWENEPSLKEWLAVLFYISLFKNFYYWSTVAFQCCVSFWYNKVNQLYIQIYTLPLWPPLPPSSPLPRSSQSTDLSPMLHSRFPRAICFTHGSVCVSLLVSQFVSPSPSTTSYLFYTWVYVCQCYSLNLSHSLLPWYLSW